MAVGHSILVIAWHQLTRSTEYQDLGPTCFDDRDRRLVERNLFRRLEGLGYRVALTHTAPRLQPVPPPDGGAHISRAAAAFLAKETTR
jgi:hypothetical protein